MQTLTFLGTIYILSDILPVLSKLSHFQRDSLNFSAILPAISQCRDKLTELKEEDVPLQKLSSDIDSFTDMCQEIKMNPRESNELQNLLHTYIDSLLANLDRRFSDRSNVLTTFSIFDPTAMPKSDEPGFKTYREHHVSVLGYHFFDNYAKNDKFLTHWRAFK